MKYTYDYSYLYDVSQKIIKPEFKLFHHSADSSTIFFQLNSANILYGKLNEDSIQRAKIWIKYKLREKSTAIIDSAIYAYTDIGDNNENWELQGEIRFYCPAGEYNLEIRLRDENKDLNVVYRLNIDKNSNFNEQYFLVKDEEKIKYDFSLDYGKTYRLLKSPLISETDFGVETNEEESIKASPPFAFSNINEKIFHAESIDTLRFVENEIVYSLNHKRARIFPLSKPESRLYLFSYYSGFPEITAIRDLIDPIRYISTNNEFEMISNTDNQKEAFEKFWIKLGENESNAQNLIREYYSRVEIANRYFTSFKEGWKTDRGIIFIVYGQPFEVIKVNNTETWLYGEENNILSVKFQFNQINSDWSNNEFKLSRDENFKNNWYRAVDVWRQGKIN